MKKTILAASLMAMAAYTGISGSAHAEATGQLDVITPPAGYVKAHHQEGNGSSITEYLLEGENVHRWSRMITVMVLPVPESKMNLFLQKFVEGYAANCLEQTAYTAIDTPGPSKSHQMACDNMDVANKPPQVDGRKNELLRFHMAGRGNHIIILQQAWHHDNESARAMLQDEKMLEEFGQIITSLKP